MKLHKLSNTLIAAAIINAIGVGVAVAGITPTLIMWDPDGNGGANGTLPASSFDWVPDSALITDDPVYGSVIPFLDGETKSAQIYSHGILAGTKPLASSPDRLNKDFEITFTSGFPEEGTAATTNSPGDTILFTNIPADSETPFDNFFRIYYDDLTDTSGQQANELTGMGYNDGEEILRATIVDSIGDFVRTTPLAIELLDQNISVGATQEDDWNGTTTIVGGGDNLIYLQVDFADPRFFKDLTKGSIITFTNQQKVPFKQADPSQQFDTATMTVSSEVGETNGISGDDMLLQVDASNNFSILPFEASCRVTGGGNDTSGIPINGDPGWDESVAMTIGRTTGNKKRYTWWWTMGGQAGANTGSQPQPKGEWEHNNRGEFGDWAFHAGTASAINGTEVDVIVCSDEGWCKQARPAPTKQIDFEGVGNFTALPGAGDKTNPQGKDVGKPGEDPFALFDFFNVTAKESLHWFDVHIEDLGEPGNIAQAANIGKEICPAPDLTDPKDPIGGGSGTDAFATPPVFNDANCECPDYYRIRIYAGLTPDELASKLGISVADIYDESGRQLTDTARDYLKNYGKTLDADGDGLVDRYTAEGYIDGGNFQIHPPTGFDLKN